MLEAVVLAEAKDHANWELLARACRADADGSARPQLEAVSRATCWSRRRSTSLGPATPEPHMLLPVSATGGVSRRPPAEDIVRRRRLSRDELYASAQELGDRGPVADDQEELAHAVASRQGAAR